MNNKLTQRKPVRHYRSDIFHLNYTKSLLQKPTRQLKKISQNLPSIRPDIHGPDIHVSYRALHLEAARVAGYPEKVPGWSEDTRMI